MKLGIFSVIMAVANALPAQESRGSGSSVRDESEFARERCKSLLAGQFAFRKPNKGARANGKPFDHSQVPYDEPMNQQDISQSKDKNEEKDLNQGGEIDQKKNTDRGQGTYQGKEIEHGRETSPEKETNEGTGLDQDKDTNTEEGGWNTEPSIESLNDQIIDLQKALSESLKDGNVVIKKFAKLYNDADRLKAKVDSTDTENQLGGAIVNLDSMILHIKEIARDRCANHKEEEEICNEVFVDDPGNYDARLVRETGEELHRLNIELSAATNGGYMDFARFVKVKAAIEEISTSIREQNFPSELDDVFDGLIRNLAFSKRMAQDICETGNGPAKECEALFGASKADTPVPEQPAAESSDIDPYNQKAPGVEEVELEAGEGPEDTENLSLGLNSDDWSTPQMKLADIVQTLRTNIKKLRVQSLSDIEEYASLKKKYDAAKKQLQNAEIVSGHPGSYDQILEYFDAEIAPVAQVVSKICKEDPKNAEVCGKVMPQF